MFVTIINDCRDANAAGRQATRAAALFGAPVHLVGVSSDLEAAGNVVDVLDAAGGAEGVVLVNVAPRHGAAKKWPNGTPFGWFRSGRTLVAASIDGLTLSLAKKLGIADAVNVLDIPTVIAQAVTDGLIGRRDGERVVATQFRSFEFLPRAAAWIASGADVPSERMDASEVPDAPPAVWWIDNFGNCKTTLLEGEEAGLPFPRYPRLKDVPDGGAALIVGSSGFGDRRFLELVVQGGNAARELGVRSGLLTGSGQGSSRAGR
jgi:hypothetical protein